MKKPSPTEIAQAVRNPLAIENSQAVLIAQAIEKVRARNAAKYAKPVSPEPDQPIIPSHEDPNPNRLQSTHTVAKALGYVSERNWHGSLRKFFVNQWAVILSNTPANFGWDFRELPKEFMDGGKCFDYYDKRGWDKRSIEWLKNAHDAYLTLAHKRPKPCQKKSAGKQPAKRRS